jgi:Sel1 repeat.
MPVFMSIGQLKRLNDCDAYIFNAILECSPSVSDDDACWSLAAKYVQQVTGSDLNKEVSLFDTVMILVEDLVCYSKSHGFPDSVEPKGEVYETIVIEASEPKQVIPDIDTIKILAEKGDVSAEYALGRAYYLGEDVPENKHVARRWLRKSAEKRKCKCTDTARER